MPTTLGNPFSPTWGGVPPHISGEDLALWYSFRDTIVKDSLRLYFDVGLGGQTIVPEGTSPEMALMWLRSTQKRIDVLIEKEDKWIIVELRARAQASAVGRLLQYQKLWKDDPPNLKKVDLMLVTNSVDQDTKDLAESLGITFLLV